MTDCYICGHPVLEGQVPGVVWGWHWPLWKFWKHGTQKAHFNPADHLPTLQRLTVEYSSEAIVEQERERAAKIVEEGMLNSKVRRILAQHIRGGDE